MDRSGTDRARARRATTIALLAVGIIAISRPASAACHIAAFTDDSLSVNESAGKVTLTVELVGGQPSCAGTVEYQTVDGTAKAGSDYASRQGDLTFVAGDDRRESFDVPITNDTKDESAETFTVRLSGGTGTISADDTATVTIGDNDPAPSTTSPSPTRSATPSPSKTKTASKSATPTISPEPSASRSPSPSASPSASPSPTPSETPTEPATEPVAPVADTSDSNAGVIAGIVGALAILAGGVVWLKRRRTLG